MVFQSIANQSMAYYRTKGEGLGFSCSAKYAERVAYVGNQSSQSIDRETMRRSLSILPLNSQM